MGRLIPTQQKVPISVNLDPQNDLSNLSRHPDAQEHTVGCQLEFPGVGTRVIRRFRLFRYADPSDAMQLRRYPETSIAIWYELDKPARPSQRRPEIACRGDIAQPLLCRRIDPWAIARRVSDTSTDHHSSKVSFRPNRWNRFMTPPPTHRPFLRPWLRRSTKSPPCSDRGGEPTTSFDIFSACTASLI